MFLFNFQRNKCLAAYSLALNILLVLTLSGILIFLFFLGLRFSIFIVYLSATILQIYFCLILHDFYKVQIKASGTVSNSSGSSPDPDPESASLHRNSKPLKSSSNRNSKYIADEL